MDTFDRWTKNKKKQLDEERDQKILDLYLQCIKQNEISKELDVSEATVSLVLEKIFKNSKFAEIKDFKVNLYNIWSYLKQGDTDTTVFGTLPSVNTKRNTTVNTFNQPVNHEIQVTENYELLQYLKRDNEWLRDRVEHLEKTQDVIFERMDAKPGSEKPEISWYRM